MGATPDTSVDLDIGTGGGYDNTALVAFCVVSGADTSTFMDATYVGPTDNGTGDADSASITTVTDGAYVLSLGFEAAGVWALGSAPTGYDTPASGLAEQSTFLDVALFLAGKVVSTAGAEDPGAWNNTVTSSFGAASYTFAFRPASGGSGGDTFSAPGIDIDTTTASGSFSASGAETSIPLAKWSGGSVSILPSTTWAAPANLFPTEDRNDDSTYSFAAATSTLTLPATDLADGYLIVGAFEFEDTSNGRHNPQGRFVQASGTGNFVSGSSSGYNRDTSEDRSYVRTWAFVDSPSASSTLQFQWRRDSDAPTGGTVRSEFQVIPLYYSNHGIYSSASTACPGGTTPTQITGFSAVDESDTSAIEIASNVVTLKGDNKRYLALGSSYWQGIGNARSQRWHGFRVDGTMDDTAKGYSYARSAANADIGEMFTTIIERETTDITVDQFVYRGPAVGAFPNAGADVDGNTTGSNPNHVTVILELNDGAEVFGSHSTTQQDIDVAGTRVDLQIADSVDFNDSASFAKTSATEIDSVQATDVLLGANVSGGYATTSTARYTGYAELTINGTGQGDTFAGDYGRGNQGTQDCWGWSANLMSFVATSASDELGVNAGKITGGEGGTVDTLAGWVGFWGLNIQTLKPVVSSGDTFGGDGVDVEPTVGTATIAQDHKFTGTGITSEAAIGQAAIGQDHKFIGSGIEADTEIGTGSFSEVHKFSAGGLEQDNALGTASISQDHKASGQPIEVDTEIGTATVSQTHKFGGDGIEVESTIAAGNFGGVSTVDTFAGTGIDVDSDIGQATIGQDHKFGASGLSVDNEVGAGTFSQETNFSASGIESETTLGSASVAQVHKFSSAGISNDNTVGSAQVNQSGGFTAGGIENENTVGSANITQIHKFASAGIATETTIGFGEFSGGEVVEESTDGGGGSTSKGSRGGDRKKKKDSSYLDALNEQRMREIRAEIEALEQKRDEQPERQQKPSKRRIRRITRLENRAKGILEQGFIPSPALIEEIRDVRRQDYDFERHILLLLALIAEREEEEAEMLLLLAA